MINKLKTYLAKKTLQNSIRVRAYALIYALMVLVLISVFSTVYLNLYYSNEHRLVMVFMQQDLRRDTKMALIQGLKENKINNGVYKYPLAPLSTFTFKTKPWGVFSLVEAKGERQTFTETYHVLTGYTLQTEEAPSLYFENNDVLKIGGASLITKKAIVPIKGVERAYINTKGKSRPKLVEGEVVKLNRKSKKILPTTDVLTYKPDLKPDIEKATILPYIPGKNYYNSFVNEVMIIEAKEHAFINSRIEGHIKILGEDSIVVTKDAQLKKVQIIAPKIRVESNFKGNMQCFAEQFIYVEEGAKLQYPSVLFLSTDSLNSGLVLEKNAEVEGVVIATKSSYERYLQPQVEFKKDSKVTGQVITNLLNTQFSGHIYGSAYLNTMFLKTKSSVYTNHLLDAEINIDKLPKDRKGCAIGDFTGPQGIINWIDHKTL